MVPSEEEQLRRFIDIVEKEGIEIPKFENDQLTAWRELFSESERNKDLAVSENENEVDSVEHYFRQYRQ